MFQPLLDSLAAALGFMNQDTPTRAVVELEEQGQVAESRSDPKMPSFPLMKRKDAAFVASRIRFCDSGRLNISVP